ncbi:MAG TPA: YIP1 family protein [Gemmatimonadales bacterium]|nr:YIP1 family protein [Gemmatimonadales bacterium]
MGVTAPPPATSQTSLISDMLDVFNVLHDPAAVFNRIKERPRILAPWIVLSVAFVVITILTRPYQQAAMDAFKATLTPEQAAKMGAGGAGGGGGGVVGLVLTPVGVLAALAIGAGVLWMAVAITGAQARYKTVLSVLAYSCITYVFFAVVGIVVLLVRGKQTIAGLADLRAPLGLDLLVPNAGLYIGTVLNGINPFSVWGVWLTGTGISITHGTSRGTAIAVTAGAFLLCLLIIAAPTLLLGLVTKQ